MECPHCYKDIPATAIRCKHCRRPVTEDRERGKLHSLKSRINSIAQHFAAFWVRDKNYKSCPWALFDVIILSGLIALFIFKDPFQLGTSILKFLRVNFFIFTREPKLLYYLAIYINTVLLKGFSIVFLFTLMWVRRIHLWKNVVFSGEFPDLRGVWLPLYIGLCVILQAPGMQNPLLPNIPFNSIFAEARIIGNIAIIFSVLVVAPFVEEVLFRGFLYPALNKHMGIRPAVVVTSILFTLAHYSVIRDDYFFAAVIFVLSVVITYARAKTGSTKLAIIMHGVYNSVSVGMGFISYLIVKY